MGKKGFKELMVWQQAKDLAVMVYRLSKKVLLAEILVCVIRFVGVL